MGDLSTADYWTIGISGLALFASIYSIYLSKRANARAAVVEAAEKVSEIRLKLLDISNILEKAELKTKEEISNHTPNNSRFTVRRELVEALRLPSLFQHMALMELTAPKLASVKDAAIKASQLLNDVGHEGAGQQDALRFLEFQCEAFAAFRQLPTLMLQELNKIDARKLSNTEEAVALEQIRAQTDVLLKVVSELSTRSPDAA